MAFSDDKERWFEKVKDVAERLGFAKDMKSYKEHPEGFKGHVGDVAMVLRITLTHSMHTPDLYDIIQVMGEERVRARLNRFLEE